MTIDNSKEILEDHKCNAQPHPFKTKISGYDRKEVDIYIKDLQVSFENSQKSYQEKIEELQNSLRIVTKELDNANQSIATIENEYKQALDKLKSIKDQSDNIKNITEENKQLKLKQKENEDYIKTSAELTIRNSQLKQQLGENTAIREKSEVKQKALENNINELNMKLQDSEYMYKTDTTTLNVKLEIAEERRIAELTNISRMISEISKTINDYNLSAD